MTDAQKASRREYMKRWRAENKEHVRESFRRWQGEHRDDRSAYAGRWRESNPGSVQRTNKACLANRRYRGRISNADVLMVIERDGNKCHWCGKENLQGRDLTLEHLKRVNDVEHLTIACNSCNSRRKANAAAA